VLRECSVNNSIIYSLQKESKSPSAEQTSVMKQAFLESENPCLTLSKVIAWPSKKNINKPILLQSGNQIEQASFCDNEPRAIVSS